MFEGHRLLAYRNFNPVMDIDITIAIINGSTLKSLSLKYKISASAVRTKKERILRRMQYLIKRTKEKDKEYLSDIFYNIDNKYSNEQQKNLIIKLLNDYKVYVQQNLKNGSLIKPFKKDILVPKKFKERKTIRCEECKRYYKFKTEE